MKTRVILFFLVTAGATCPAALANWPQWRGPNRNGVGNAVGLPVTWSETENIRWKAPLPSWGGATPIVWGDRVFVLSPSEPRETSSVRVGRRFRRGGREHPGGPELLLLCFSTHDGSLLWKHTLDSGNQLFGKQNMASPSPVTDGKHIWAMTGTGVLTALELQGDVIWRRDLQADFGRFAQFWGYASSPLLYDGRIIVEVLHGESADHNSYVVAFDAGTGTVRWKVDRVTDAPKESADAYTTPTISRRADRTDLIISGADLVTGHDPRTGAEVWRAGGLNPKGRGNFRICGSPVAVDGFIYASSRVSPVVAFRAGGKGDVTQTHKVWTYEHPSGTDVPSLVSDGQHVYIANDKGIVTCLDAQTGAVVWGPERTATGTCSASPVLADGKLYITNEAATTTVLAAGPELKVLATNELDGGYTIASMAIAGADIFLRSATHLYCISRQEPATTKGK